MSCCCCVGLWRFVVVFGVEEMCEAVRSGKRWRRPADNKARGKKKILLDVNKVITFSYLSITSRYLLEFLSVKSKAQI